MKNKDLPNVAIGLGIALALLGGYVFGGNSSPSPVSAPAPIVIVVPTGSNANESYGDGSDESLGRFVHQRQEIFVAGIKAGSSETEVINSSAEWVGVVNGSTFTGTTGTFSGAVTSDSPTFVVDATNNKVGFGTTTPTTLVTVGSTTPTLITTAEQYRSLFVAGQSEFDGVSVFEGLFQASTTALFGAGVTMDTTLGVTGAGTFSSTVDVTGIFTANTAATNLASTTVSGTLTSFRLSSTTTADLTLTHDESTQITFIGTTAATTTLPSVGRIGTTYTFQVIAAWTGADIAITSAEGDNISGSLFVADTIVACANEDHVNFINDGEAIGDFVEFVSIGTGWQIVNSRGETAAKLTCTDPT